jgi:transcriptional regulator with XRE-family HTH domain
MSEEFFSHQVRAARALIGWHRADLAKAAGITERQLARIEANEVAPFKSTITKITNALAEAGVELIPENGKGAGVRLLKR